MGEEFKLYQSILLSMDRPWTATCTEADGTEYVYHGDGNQRIGVTYRNDRFVGIIAPKLEAA